MEVRGDKRTFEIVREMGDSLEGIISIRLTADYPTNHLYSKVIESPSDPTSLWREGVERIEPKARFFQHLH